MISSSHESWVFGTHLHPLLTCVLATQGSVLEFGCGEWSTPVLHAYCLSTGRRFVSVDQDRGWADKIGAQLGVVIQTPDISALLKEEWSGVLVDSWPAEERSAIAAAMIHVATFVLVHDYELPMIAEPLDLALRNCRYRRTYCGATPKSIAISATREIPSL